MRSGRTVVTGAAGGLGRALLAQLPPSAVTAVVRRDLPAGLAGTVVRVDVRHATWSELVRRGDVVFHLAAWVHRRADTPGEVARAYEINAVATARLAAACCSAGATLVFSSTVAVHGVQDDPASLRRSRGPSEYARSKLAAEEAIRAEGDRGLRYAILRFPLMYGPFGSGNMERMLRAISRGAYWPVGDPTTPKSCLFFGDASSALLLAAREASAQQGTHVVSSESPYTLGEIHAAAYRSLGRAVPGFCIPRSMALLLAGGADLGQRALFRRRGRLTQQVRALTAPAAVDGSRFAAMTGFHPTVSLDEGLRLTAAWLAGCGGAA